LALPTAMHIRIFLISLLLPNLARAGESEEAMRSAIEAVHVQRALVEQHAAVRKKQDEARGRRVAGGVLMVLGAVHPTASLAFGRGGPAYPHAPGRRGCCGEDGGWPIAALADSLFFGAAFTAAGLPTWISGTRALSSTRHARIEPALTGLRLTF